MGDDYCAACAGHGTSTHDPGCVVAACRYCGILPDQDLPRPSYRDLRAERDRYREALTEAKALLAAMVDASPKGAPADCTGDCMAGPCNCSGVPMLFSDAVAAVAFLDRVAALDGEDSHG